MQLARTSPRGYVNITSTSFELGVFLLGGTTYSQMPCPRLGSALKSVFKSLVG